MAWKAFTYILLRIECGEDAVAGSAETKDRKQGHDIFIDNSKLQSIVAASRLTHISERGYVVPCKNQ